MLSKEDNELLTRVGPGSAMGDLLRQYWIPALLSSELPEPDGAPLRLRLLGEDLVIFRDTAGQVGLLGAHCPHRGASLYFGRNEECGLRCVYHGWKFDVTGQCVDMPSEPPESSFKHKIKATAYPCREHGGMIWAYMGPRAVPPELPALEWTTVSPEHRTVWPALRECNWAQGLEGDIDTAHLYFLHARLNSGRDESAGVFHEDVHPRLELVETAYGMMYGARREEGPDHYYWRITQFMFPFHTFFPPGGLGGVPGHIWVPLDDEHTMVWSIAWNPDGPVMRSRIQPSMEFLPATSAPTGRWRPAANKQNDYQIDREAQRTTTFTGIPNIFLQDQAMTESMGPIVDRSHEHLGTTDAMVIQVRRRLIQAARALRDGGVTPPCVDDPSLYGVRSASLVLPRDVNWYEATQDVVKAYSGLPVATD
jgi:phenylpropionate dioxygenase-like ring-hydroxylating dioxygenase large terminal subunit